MPFLTLVFAVLIVVLQNVSESEASIKKGLCVGPENFRCDDFKVWSHVNWWYDWTKNLWWLRLQYNCSLDDFAQNFIPMVWGWRPQDHPVVIIPEAKYVLGFNEPNMIVNTYMSPRAAANHWKEIDKNSRGLPLVGPATAECHNPKNCHGNATQWLDKFFHFCNGSCRMEYLATHVYKCNADDTMEYLQMLYHRYGKKLWLTEFACPHTHSADTQLNYMKQLLPRLEAADFIVRYSWFNSRVTDENYVKSSASLLEPHESKLTPLGQYYNSFRGTGGQPIG